VKRCLAALFLPGIALAQSGAVGTTGVYNSTSPALTNGQIQTLQLDSQGRLIGAPLQVGAGGTVSLSGVPVVTPTTSGNIKPGLAPQQGTMHLGQYSLNLPTVSGGQTVGLQTDNAGRLLIGSIYALPPVQLAPLLRGLPVVTLPPVSFASYRSAATVALAASATDFACLPGNATNTVIVDEVHASGIQTTPSVVALFLVKRSVADIGSSNSMTAVADDANFPAASSAPVNYTANPTTGALVGNLDITEVGFLAVGTAAANDIYIGNFKAKPVILRGTAQEVCFNMNAVTVTGGTAAVEFHWYEVANLSSFTP
jgi:hypothetical protein